MAGMFRPVFADASTKDAARMFDNRLNSPSILSLSTSPGFGLTRFHLSTASLPSPFTFSKTTVWAFLVISTRLAL